MLNLAEGKCPVQGHTVLGLSLSLHSLPGWLSFTLAFPWICGCRVLSWDIPQPVSSLKVMITPPYPGQAHGLSGRRLRACVHIPAFSLEGRDQGKGERDEQGGEREAEVGCQAGGEGGGHFLTGPSFPYPHSWNIHSWSHFPGENKASLHMHVFLYLFPEARVAQAPVAWRWDRGARGGESVSQILAVWPSSLKL